MTTLLDVPAVRDTLVRLNVDHYHRLCEAGIVAESTELLSGMVVAKIGKSPRHTWTVEFLAEWFRQVVDSEFVVRVEQPLTLSESEPEPDIAIVCGTRGDFRHRHPGFAELVIEVALFSQDIDRAKAAIYSAAGVPEYWLVLPQVRTVEIHSCPGANGYASVQTYTAERHPMLNFAGKSLAMDKLFAD